MQKPANCLTEKIMQFFSSSCFSFLVLVVVLACNGRAGRGKGAEMKVREVWTPRNRANDVQHKLQDPAPPEGRQLDGGGVVDHSLVKKYFLELYNKALRRAIMEQEAAAKAQQHLDPLRRSSFNGAFGSAMKSKFGKEGARGYSSAKLEEQGRGGVQAFTTGVEPFGGGHKHKHHHHKHTHLHENEHEHEHKHLHEHEEEHKHKAKHQHVHKHEHHHEHNHHHKHKEEHEHEEEHKHEHSHEHAHKGEEWRRSSTDDGIANDVKRKKIGKILSKPWKEVESVEASSNGPWEPERPATYPEYQDIEFGWDL